MKFVDYMIIFNDKAGKKNLQGYQQVLLWDTKVSEETFGRGMQLKVCAQLS